MIDIRPIPHTRYILAIDNSYNFYTFDTFTPSINYSATNSTTESPVRIDAQWPKSSDETLDNFTLTLTPVLVSTAVDIQRWRWNLRLNGQVYSLTNLGTDVFQDNQNWLQTQGSIDLTPIKISPYDAGEYIFELETVDSNGDKYKTHYGFNRIKKRAINKMFIGGLATPPEGIDFDYCGRPWIKINEYAIRLVMRTDIGIWLQDERVLLTREEYDEVRKY